MNQKWILPAVCALAGALAVPPRPLAMAVSAAIAGATGLLGLRLTQWSGLPLRVHADTPRATWWRLGPAIWMMLGLFVGLLLLTVIRLVIEPTIPSIGARIATAAAVPVWRRLVIIFVAAVGEELLFRVLLLSLIAGTLMRLRRSPSQTPANVWIANSVASLAFAAVHLPSWGGVAGGLPLAISVLALNAVGGLVLGYVFATRGIAAAMWTHAGADCAIQLVGPLTA